MSLNSNSQPVTKKELKEELKNLATKADIKNFVTKKDLKDELKKFATKKELKKGFDKIDKKLNTIINFFDHLTIDHEKRIKRLEHHAGFAPLN